MEASLIIATVFGCLLFTAWCVVWFLRTYTSAFLRTRVGVCRCGHDYVVHQGAGYHACQEGGCRCHKYRFDVSPSLALKDLEQWTKNK